MDLVEHNIYSNKLYLFEETDFNVDRGFIRLYTKGVEHSKMPTVAFESGGNYTIKSFGANSTSPNLLLFNAVYLYLCDNKDVCKRVNLGSDSFLLFLQKENKTILTHYLNALLFIFNKTLDNYRKQKSYKTYRGYLEALVNHSGGVVPYLDLFVHHKDGIVKQSSYFYTTLLDVYLYYQLLKEK